MKPGQAVCLAGSFQIFDVEQVPTLDYCSSPKFTREAF